MSRIIPRIAPFVFFVALLAMIGIASAADAPNGSVPIDVTQIFSITSGGKKYTCALVGSKYVAGSRLNGSTLFLPLSAKVKALKRKIKQASGAAKERLMKKLPKLLAQRKAGDKACVGGPNQPTPTPGGGATKTPTPVASGNFDSQGNVTAAGKAAFGIPSNLAANSNTGSSFYNSLCKGCHISEERNKSFSQYRTSTSGSPMFFTTSALPDSTLAHITAYLNRFRTS